MSSLFRAVREDSIVRVSTSGRYPPALRVPACCALAMLVLLGCGGGGGGGGEEPVPESPFSVLSGKTVLLLAVQYVRRPEGPWIGGARNAKDVARQADMEIEFALLEEAGRTTWIFPEQQVEVLRGQPMFDIDPYALSADVARKGGRDFKRVWDPLYGEIRPLVALFSARYVLFPVEVYYEQDRDAGVDEGRVVIKTVLFDGRSGTVMFQGAILGADEAVTSPGALASAAQKFAREVSR